MRIGLGVGLSTVDRCSLSDLVELIAFAEQSRFDAVWVPHISGYDALTIIGLAGRSTQRIEMVTGVLPVHSRHPLLMAQQALTVHEACGGRLTLGIGVAHPETVSAQWGLSYEKPARYMREYLEVLTPLVRGEKVLYEGEVFRVRSALTLSPVEPLNIMLAALAPHMLHLAGSRTDGTITWVAGPRTLQTHIVPRIKEAAVRAGKPPPRVCVGLPVTVTDDICEAREVIDSSLGRYATLVNYRRVLDIEGAVSPAEVAIIGNESQVEYQLRQLSASGATDFFGAVVPSGSCPQASVQRTQELLSALVGKID